MRPQMRTLGRKCLRKCPLLRSVASGTPLAKANFVARGQSGFTLVELVVVVAVVGIALSVAVPSMLRPEQSRDMETVARMLQSKVEHVRGLAGNIAPRLGDPNAALGWNYGPGCALGSRGGGYLWISLDLNGNYSVPTSVSKSMSVVSVTCESGTLESLLQMATGSALDLPQVLAPSSVTPMVFSFTGAGRTVYDQPGMMGGVPPDLVVLFETNNREQHKFGFRITPSGVVCSSSELSAVYTCDSD